MDRAGLEQLSWELSVLSRALVYPNLSAAAVHVGLSQPQLSRIVGKLENELQISLLDRRSKRKSTWTPVAHLLSETFQKSLRKMNDDFRQVIQGHQPKSVHIGTLEGLSTIGAQVAQLCFNHAKLATVELHVYDLNQLEERFFSGEIDLILTSREPGRRKFAHLLMLGHQSLRPTENKKNSHLRVLSSFEFDRSLAKKSAPKSEQSTLVSNSLFVRKNWLERLGGVGALPSEVKPGRGNEKTDQPVMLIASEQLSPVIWDALRSFKL